MDADIKLLQEPLDLASPAFAPGLGAETRFLGTVRGTEKGHPISGIRYSAYESMALRMMHELRVTALEQHGPHELLMHHRLGFVPAEQVSVVIAVRTAHSAEAFDLCRWYLAELKQRVPIWKEIVEVPGNGQG